ncbi:MAG: protoporphyrinogen/coproporphyrinogen oxidase [bacterium]
MMESTPQRVAVIGAGMAGLAAANELTKAGFRVTVFEKQPTVGGRIKTESHKGQTIEGGAQSYFAFYRLTRALIHEMDLAEQEITLSGNPGIVRNRKIAHIPSGPRFFFGNHISVRSKLRLGKLIRLLLRHWSRLDHEDLYEAHPLDTKSVAEYANQELSPEILHYLLDPILSGLFYWQSKQISQAALFVLFRRALFGLRPMTLTCGLSSLPRAIASRLDVRVNHAVTRISRTENGTYDVVVHDGSQKSKQHFDAVVCATTATAVPRLIPFLNPAQKRFFQSIKYSQNVNVAVKVENGLAQSMHTFYVPFVERSMQNLGAVARRPNRVFSLFSSARSGADLIGEPDRVVSTRLVRDLSTLLPPPAQRAFRPLPLRVNRWHEALPILDVGYFKRLKEFQSGKIESGNLLFCGDYLGGAVIEGAVSSGVKAANRLISRLRTREA